MSDVLAVIAQVLGPLAFSFAMVLIGRRAAVRREHQLVAGRTVSWPCRAQWGEGELRRGKLVAPGLGRPLTFFPRRGKPWDVPVRGRFVGTREEQTKLGDNSAIGATSVFYRTSTGVTLRFRLRTTDVPTVRAALAGARPDPGLGRDEPWHERAPVLVLRWWLLTLAGVLLLGLGVGLTLVADWRSHDVTVNVLSTDGKEHCVVSWRDPWTHERRKGALVCPDDGWVGGPLQPGDRAEAEVGGWPFRGEVYGDVSDGDTVFSAGMWISLVGLPAAVYGLFAAVVASVRRLVRSRREASRGRRVGRPTPSG